MDIRLHRVYGIITEATQRMRVGTTEGRARWKPRSETQKESGEGKEGRFLTIAPTEGRDGNHELGIRGKREGRDGWRG